MEGVFGHGRKAAVCGSPASGRKKQSVALTRTVLQRRLASSTQAIAESIRRRLEKQEGLLEELESLSPAQRSKRLAQIQGRLTDVEQDEDDLDDAQRDLLTDEFTTAIELDQLRAEIAVLRDLLAQALRAATQRRQAAALKAWNPSNKPEWLDEKTYREKVLPCLARITVPTIVSALAVSEPYATNIRAGRCIPHPRHWLMLAELTGVYAAHGNYFN